jgi:murein DD-endopeptidase MepM/ murein hydrolase activator NlpD
LGGSAKYGLMEMHLGGGQGFGMNFGANGTDVGLGTIGRAMSGMGTFVKQQEFNWYEAFGGVQYAENYTGSREVGTQLRESYSFGDQAALAQQARFLSGQDKLRVGYIGNEGQTTAVGDSRLVDLATLGQKGNIASQLAAGVVMQHEAYRNGLYDGQLMQEYETQRAVVGHTEMAMRVAKEYGYGFIAQNAKLSRDVAEYWKGPETFAKYVGDAYDKSADYWKLKRNGDLVNDGSGWLKDENGKYIRDNNDNLVGAAEVEEGLAKILGVDVGMARQIMTDSGMLHSETPKSNEWIWEGSKKTLSNTEVAALGVAGAQPVSYEEANNNKTIFSSTILENFGDTVVAPILMNGLDTLSDLALFGGSGAATVARTGVATKALDRYDALIATKQGFYYGAHQLFTADESKNVAVMGTFGQDSYYADNQHKGIDFAGPVGIDIYSLFGGKVVRNDYTESAGNTVVIEIGFGFENYFYDTGVQEQFMHLDAASPLAMRSIIDGTTFVGDMGHTGEVRPANGGDGTHLHYQLMGNIGGGSNGPTSPVWDQYRYRRDRLLSVVGSPSSSDWTASATSVRNYWSSDPYYNFYFNTNNLTRRMNINVGR